MKLKYLNRDAEATEHENRVISLTSKVDSLVKFLEEERVQRKEAQILVQ